MQKRHGFGRNWLVCSALVSLGAVTIFTSVLPVSGADLILNNQTVTLGGTQTYGTVSLTNGSRIIVSTYNGSDHSNTGNLVLRANSITIDASSSIIAKGVGYQGGLCRDGAGPATTPLAGGRGGCGVRDSAGGGAHLGGGGRGTKDLPASFPAGYEEDCVGAVNAGNTACLSTTDCRNNDGLPTVAGQSYQHSYYAAEFGAAGGDKGCRDGDGFTPSSGTSVAQVAGNGGGRIVLFAANAAQSGQLTLNGVVNANGNRGCANGNDSAGGGAGGSVLLVGDSVTVGATARLTASGGRGGDSQPKCLTCAADLDCGGSGQTCIAGRCSPCNCSPCTSNAQCNAALGQTCKALAGSFGNVCADASNQCTPVVAGYEEAECKGTQNSGVCDDCGGGGGGGIVDVFSRVASISPLSGFEVGGAKGGVCPICTNEAAGSAGRLKTDGVYLGEVCDGYDNDFNGVVDDGLPALNCNGTIIPSCVGGVPQQCPADLPTCIGPVTDPRTRLLVIVGTTSSMLTDVSGSPTFGDGSVGHLGVDTAWDPDSTDGNNSRLSLLKGALADIFTNLPNTDYALARYHQDVGVNRSCQAASWFECQQLCCSYDDPRNDVTPAFPVPPGCNMASLYPGAGYPAALNANINIGWASQADCINYSGSCGGPRRGADVLVGFGKTLPQHLMWLDGNETNFNPGRADGDHCNFSGGGDCELRATGPAPLAGALDAAADYLKPIIQCDGDIPGRNYSVILITDQTDNCMGDPVAAATALRSTVSGTSIKTYVVGFGSAPTDSAQLNAIAAAGGTGTAYFASDRNGFYNAMRGIAGSAGGMMRCGGVDVAAYGAGSMGSGTPRFCLTVTPSGTGAGSVASTPAGISCGNTCSEAFSWDTPVVLEALAHPGSQFIGWGDGSGSAAGCLGTGACSFSLIQNSGVMTTFNALKAALALVVDPANSQKIIAGIDTEGIWKSANGGATWTAATTQPSNSRIKGLVMYPPDHQTLYAATYGGGIYKSSDSGDNWSACANTGSGSLKNATALAIDASGTLYAGSEAGIFTSDNCVDWSATDVTLPATASTPPVTIVIDGSTVYTGLDGAGIFRTLNNGATWTAATMQPANLRVKALVVKPGDSTKLFAATYGGGIYVSSNSSGVPANNGLSWAVCTDGTTENSGLANLNVLSLTSDATGKLYAGTEAGVFVSSDGCTTWQELNNGLPN